MSLSYRLKLKCDNLLKGSNVHALEAVSYLLASGALLNLNSQSEISAIKGL